MPQLNRSLFALSDRLYGAVNKLQGPRYVRKFKANEIADRWITWAVNQEQCRPMLWESVYRVQGFIN